MSQWFVLKIRSQFELKAEKDLRAIGIATMAPYRETWHRIRRGRPRKRRYALFPGYAFVCLSDIGAGWQAIQGALNTDENRVALRLLPTSDNPAILTPADVGYLASVADGKYQPGDDVPRLRIGDDVLIPEGPFKGFTGRILKIRRGKTATISIKQIKLASSLEIPLANLDRV